MCFAKPHLLQKMRKSSPKTPHLLNNPQGIAKTFKKLTKLPWKKCEIATNPIILPKQHNIVLEFNPRSQIFYTNMNFQVELLPG